MRTLPSFVAAAKGGISQFSFLRFFNLSIARLRPFDISTWAYPSNRLLHIYKSMLFGLCEYLFHNNVYIYTKRVN